MVLNRQLTLENKRMSIVKTEEVAAAIVTSGALILSTVRLCEAVGPLVIFGVRERGNSRLFGHLYLI